MWIRIGRKYTNLIKMGILLKQLKKVQHQDSFIL